MTTLKLRKEMFPLINSGVKTSTSRYGVRTIKLHDKLTLVAPEDSSCTIDVIVTGIQYYQFMDLTEEEAIAEGYASLAELRATLKKLYNPQNDDYFTLIKFIPCYTLTGKTDE